MMRYGGDAPGETATPATGLPMVVWHSKMLESDHFVTAESFDYWKFKRFMDHAQVLLKTFPDFKKMSEDAISS